MSSFGKGCLFLERWYKEFSSSEFGVMKINTRFLKSHPLLALIPTFTLRKLVSQAALDEYPKGTVIYRQGQPCEAIYLVISGRCESRLAGNGVDAVFGPGDALGARELLNNEPYRSTLTVLTHSILLRIPALELQRVFAAKPSVAGRFSQSVAGRARAMQSLGLDSMPERRPPTRARRIVSLVSLSSHPFTNLGRALTHAVQEVAGGRVLLVQLVRSAEKWALNDWPALASRCDSMNGEFCLRDQVRETDAGFSELRISVHGGAEEPGFIAPLLSHLGLHFDYVLLHIAVDLPPPTALECMVQADVTYAFLRQTSQELYEFQLLMGQLGKTSCAQVRPILYIEPYLPVAEFNNALKEIGRPVHAFVRDFPVDGESTLSPAFMLHLRRLAREIAQCRIGIAFSSGAAKGLAHVGVIQVLEENGIEVDVIAGASMGAYVGSLWAHGYTGEALERIARELESRWGLLHLIDPVLPPRAGFMSSGRVARRLRRSIGDARFSDLMRPLRVVATHLETMDRVVFSSGDVVQAVEASIAIPGICVPVSIDGEMYIDGGICDPLPVDVLVEMGIERIIAVNTIPTAELLRHGAEEKQEADGRLHPSRKSLLARFNQNFNYFAHGNILDTMFRSLNGSQMRVAEASCKDADVVLWAISPDARWHDFTNPAKYIQLGRQVAEAQLTELKALVKGNHESRTEPEKSLVITA